MNHPEGARAPNGHLVFLTTPHDLHWHFHTKIDRLILQLWPVFLFGLAVLFSETPGAGGEAAGES